MHIGISLKTHEVDEWAQRQLDALGEEIDAVVALISETIAEEARSNHPYQNRTGDLQASTQALEPTGSFYSDTLLGEVVALEDYATYVEDKGYQFLEPALEAKSSQIDRMLNDAIERAVAMVR